MKFFSIITIHKDDLDGLITTCNSVDHQTEKDFEHIIIDSSHEGYIKQIPADEKRNIFFSPPNGIYDALNIGTKKSTGRYIIYMNAGDIFASNHILEEVKKVCLEENADLIYGDSYNDYGKERVYKKSGKHTELFWGMFTHHQSMFFLRDKLIKNKILYSTKYDVAGDYDFICNFINCSDSFHYYSKAVSIFKIGGYSYKEWWKGLNQQYLIKIKYFNFLGSSIWYFIQLGKNIIARIFPWIYKLRLKFKKEFK